MKIVDVMQHENFRFTHVNVPWELEIWPETDQM